MFLCPPLAFSPRCSTHYSSTFRPSRHPSPACVQSYKDLLQQALLGAWLCSRTGYTRSLLLFKMQWGLGMMLINCLESWTWCFWNRSQCCHHYKDWTDLPFKSGRMHTCKDALRTFYFKHMQGKSHFENSKSLFILPTPWWFFPNAQTDFFLTTWKSYKFFPIALYHTIEALSAINSFPYSTRF